MNGSKKVKELLLWLVVLLPVALAVGCGGGGGDGSILGGGVPALTPATYADVIKPRVASTIPAATSVVAPVNAAITATFTKNMASATINPGSFTLVNTTASAVVAATSVTYDAGSKTATFTPSAPLTATDQYTATITTAATDLAGNPLAGNQAALPAASNYVWTFTASAADVTSPTVVLESPAASAVGVAINTTINATFSEAMMASTLNTTTFTVQASGVLPTITGAVTYNPLTYIATFTPSANLAANTTYVAKVTAAATDLAGNALAAGAKPNPWSFTTGSGLAPGAVPLASAGTFGLMATAAVTAANASIINGDVSLEPGTSITGFPPALINGALHVNDTVSHQARADLLASYNTAKGLACATTVGSTDLGTLYVYPTGIPPGVYCSGSTMLVGAHIVLDAGGDANAVWVFQIGSSLTTGADVTLINGAQAKNVFWVPTLDATIGSGTTFNGTLITGRDATSAGSATINGRILAGATTAGTIALNGPPSIINVPAP